MEYRILGPLDVSARPKPSLGGPKQRGVLALLVLNAGRVVSVDRLVDELWHGHPPRRAQATLRSYLSRLRTTLERAAGRPVLLTRAPGYLLEIAPDEVDAARFERLVRDGQTALAGGQTEYAADLLRGAQSLWRGPVLEDLSELETVRNERARLEEVRLVALESRIEADLAGGRHTELVGELDALLTEHPLRERLHEKRMLALYRCGRQAEALAAFQRARTMLAEDLGIEPGAALRRMHQAVLEQDPALDWTPITRPAEPVSAPEQADPFVGRTEEMAQLRQAMAEVLDGRGQVVLLAGEPGIGKSRTAWQLAAEADTGGFAVLCGRAWEEEGAPAFWPWTKALRTWLEGMDDDSLRTVCGPDAAVLAQLAPVVAERVPGLAAPPPLKAAEARFRLFDVVTRVLGRAAGRQPLLLLLDDLHWADVPSLRLLQFLARELPGSRILVVATYRDIEESPDVKAVLSELWREQSTRHLQLPGLRSAEIAEYIELVSPGLVTASLAAELAAELRIRTGGNPFFLRELVRLLQDEGGLDRAEELGDRVPQGVRAAVERRLAVLPDPVQASLSLAAVAGRSFSLSTLVAAGDVAVEPALAHLEQASAAGLITELPDAPGQYSFAHALVRDALYTALSGVRRAWLHLRVGQAIERIHGHDLDLHLAELAHHFRQANEPIARVKAAEYSARAGERAVAVYAYEEAIRQFRLALAEAEDPSRQGELLLLLADAQTRAGDTTTARQTCHRAAALARAAGRPRQLAQAGVLLYDDPLEFGAFNPPLVELLEEAMAGLDDGAPALRAKVAARLAMALSWQPAGDSAERAELDHRVGALTERAVELARDVGDSAVLAYALGARNYVHSGPDHTEERLTAADEMLRLARTSGDLSWELQARRWRVITFAELGRFERFDLEVEAYAATADELRMPDYLPWVPLWKGLRAVMAGDLTAAERLAARAKAAAPDPVPPAVVQGHGAALWTLRREQGRLAELDLILAGFVEKFPERQGWRAALALTLAAAGRADEARGHLGGLARAGFTEVPRDRGWLLTMTRLAETCVRLRDIDRARVLYDLLLPFEQRFAVAFGVAATGPVAFHLGRLAEIAGRSRAARGHYEVAAELSLAAGAKSWIAQVSRHL